MTFSLLINLAIVLLVAFIVLRVATVYAQTTGTPWQRLLATGSGSAVVLKEYVLIMGGAAVMGAENITQMLGFPEAQELMKSIPAEYVGWAFVATAVLGIVARMRTLWSK